MHPGEYASFPYAGWWKEREGREGGKSIHPSTPAQGLLNGIPYAGWWRVREEEKRRKVVLSERESEKSQDPRRSVPLVS
jgi:hypothetical protein